MRKVVVAPLLAVFVGCSCEAKPRPESGFGRAVMEQAAEKAEREGRKQEARNQRLVQAKWQFTTADARVKLRRLYPSTR